MDAVIKESGIFGQQTSTSLHPRCVIIVEESSGDPKHLLSFVAYQSQRVHKLSLTAVDLNTNSELSGMSNVLSYLTRIVDNMKSQKVAVSKLPDNAVGVTFGDGKRRITLDMKQLDTGVAEHVERIIFSLVDQTGELAYNLKQLQIPAKRASDDASRIASSPRKSKKTSPWKVGMSVVNPSKKRVKGGTKITFDDD